MLAAVARAPGRLLGAGGGVRGRYTRWFHCRPSVTHPGGIMDVHLIPVHDDNYCYLVVDHKTRESAVVDPAQPEKVWQWIQENGGGVVPKTILTTHHHWDHADGNETFKTLAGVDRVVGMDERIPALNHKVQAGSSLTIGSLHIDVLHTPSHTSGHVSYVVTPDGDGPKAVFTGDTLFVGGCGRFFEGTAAEMCQSLGQLAALPQSTLVYCGHEYTTSNLRFAQQVEPHNSALQAKVEWAKERRANNQATIPSTIGEELQYNPFMRVDQPAVLEFTGKSDPVEVCGELRARKNAS